MGGMAALDAAVRMTRLALAMMPLVLVCAGAWLVVRPGTEHGGRKGEREPVASRRSSSREGRQAEAEEDGRGSRAKAEVIRELEELLKTATDDQLDLVLDKVAAAMVQQPLETLHAVLAAPEWHPRHYALALVARRFPKEDVKELLVALRDSPVKSDSIYLSDFFDRTSEFPPSAEVEQLFDEDTDGLFSVSLARGLGFCLEMESEGGESHDAPPLYVNAGMDSTSVKIVNNALLERLAIRQPLKALARLEEKLAHRDEFSEILFVGSSPESIFGRIGGAHEANPEVEERVLELAARYGEKATVVPFAVAWTLKQPDEAVEWVLTIPDAEMRERTVIEVGNRLHAGLIDKPAIGMGGNLPDTQ